MHIKNRQKIDKKNSKYITKLIYNMQPPSSNAQANTRRSVSQLPVANALPSECIPRDETRLS